MKAPRAAVVTVGLVAVLATAWVIFHALGHYVTVQKQGGWTDQTEPIDFSEDPGARVLLEAFPADSEVDNVILLLADGMGFAHVTAARAQLVGINRLLTFERFPVTRWVDSHSVNEVYIDSAASATALATGVRTFSGALGVSARGARVKTLFEAAREAGKATGSVTDSYFFDATPAAFSVHLPDRDSYAGVIEQMANSGNDVVIGEVREDYPQDEAATVDLHQMFRTAGYEVATTASELWGLPWQEETQLAGIFAAGVVADDEIEPRLPQLFDLALSRLSADAEGFVLVAETEDPDSGSHDHDFRQVMRGVGKLEEMTKKAVAFARSNRRTLVLVTGDHETGGLALISGDARRRLGLRWLSTSHTGAPLPLYAFGAGAGEFAVVRDNTDVAPIIARLLGVELDSSAGSPASTEVK